MEALINKAKQLLEAGSVKVVVGYGKGTGGALRPLLARTAAEAAKLVPGGDRGQNLATYVTKPEIRALGRIALVATTPALRSLLQLAAEKQLREENILALAVVDGDVREFATFAAIEEFVATQVDAMPEADRQRIEQLRAMSVGERRAFWAAELNRCVKCYACRSSCPMCYCERCTMDCNRPQWIPVASHALGNLEYHMVRAMHLAGRCVECGTCGTACPVGIPVHLLTFFAEESVRQQFGQRGGGSANVDYAMSTFKPDDKETFIR
jgi:ferredoxin